MSDTPMIDAIVEAITAITLMEAVVSQLETQQQSVSEADRPARQLHIARQIGIMDAAKSRCMQEIRRLSQDELRVLGARTGARF